MNIKGNGGREGEKEKRGCWSGTLGGEEDVKEGDWQVESGKWRKNGEGSSRKDRGRENELKIERSRKAGGRTKDEAHECWRYK